VKTTLFIPVLNEIEAMRQVLPRLPKGCCDQILVVDGQSRDGSAEYARSLGCDVYVQKEKGLRAAYSEGIQHATGEVIVTFSPDGNSLPEKIPELIDKMREGYDMVIVSRYLGGARSEDDDMMTGFGNWMFTSLINFFFSSNYTDALVMFRAYRKDIVKRLGFDKPVFFMEWFEKKIRTLSGWEPQMSMRCAKARLRVGEIPGDEPPRIGGVRKITPWRSGAVLSVQILYEFLT